MSPTELLAKTPEDKTANLRRITYQIPEADGGPCGRSFEDAFILANPELFELGECSDLAALAYELAGTQKKSTFALSHAIENTEWNVPRYIADGLRWLAQSPPAPIDPLAVGAVEIITEVADVDPEVTGEHDHG